MKNNPVFLIGAVILGLIGVTAIATVTSTSPKPASSAVGATGAGSANLDFSNRNASQGSAQEKPREAQQPGKSTGNLTRIAWESSFEKALKKSKSTGKPVMVDFYAEWCGACKHLDRNIYTASPVINESDNFINVKVDADKRTDLQQKYQISGLPTIVWINAQGVEVKRLQGAPPEPDYMVEVMRQAHTEATSGSAL